MTRISPRIALSCEALRTTTRMMHAIAWLLNQRAYFSGELSEFQLRHHGRPAAGARPSSRTSTSTCSRLELVELIERTQRFYARIERLDEAWRTRFADAAGGDPAPARAARAGGRRL
jgi:regulator of CtrA degradation